ncbi:MAG: hypothetical protein HRT73_02365 [Flavobacteriales bacterium]|nr:hypothetical protein [Flavobacteriales bacterium]NQX96709.1 hypothetical protein [Flavobacteriales bacterium]
MKNLMQKLVKVTLCLGVVSVSLIACEPDVIDNNILDLDRIDEPVIKIDSLMNDSVLIEDSILIEPVIGEGSI